MTTDLEHTKDLCDGCGAVLAMPADPTQKPVHKCPLVEVLTPMLGAVIKSIQGAAGEREMAFFADDGRVFRFLHHQDCCENVNIEDIAGDLDDLVGSPLVLAEVVSNEDNSERGYNDDSHTWTFYKFSTIKGSVTVRWLGESNGYYSESVDFEVEPAAKGAA